MSLPLSLLPNPFSSNPCHSQSHYEDIMRQVENLNFLKSEGSVIAKLALKCFFESENQVRKSTLRSDDKRNFKAILLKPSNNMSEVYIYEQISSAVKKERRDHPRHNNKSFIPSLRISFNGKNVIVDRAALLKFNNFIENDKFRFNHELSLLEYIKEMPQVTYLQNSLIYEGKSEKQPCEKGLLFLDYYDGGELHEILTPAQSCPPEVLHGLFSRLLKILLTLNEAHVIHNDIKMENFFLNAKQNEVFLGDWEFAVKESDIENPELKKLFRSGTPCFISPEKFSNLFKSEFPDLPFQQFPDLRSNAWSVGCILFILLKETWPPICLNFEDFFEAGYRQNLFSKDFPNPLELIELKQKIIETLNEMVNNCPPQQSFIGLINGLMHPNPDVRLTAQQALEIFEQLDIETFKQELEEARKELAYEPTRFDKCKNSSSVDYKTSSSEDENTQSSGEF